MDLIDDPLLSFEASTCVTFVTDALPDVTIRLELIVHGGEGLALVAEPGLRLLDDAVFFRSFDDLVRSDNKQVGEGQLDEIKRLLGGERRVLRVDDLSLNSL